MKKSRILILLLALALCFGCISCTNVPEDTDDAANADDGANAEPQKLFSEITETGAEKFDPDATVEDIVFSYDIRHPEINVPVHKTTYRSDEEIPFYGYITNVSQKDFTYIGTGELDMTLSLYCETDDGKYVMSYSPIKMNSSIPTECSFEAGATHCEVRYTFNSAHNAPAGSYHLEIGVAGFTQTFYNVLTVTE